MGAHDTRLEEYLAKVEGGGEVLAAREHELNARLQAERGANEQDRLTLLARAGELRLGSGRLPDNFWELSRPEDPENSVRRALEEDRL